MWLLGPFVPWTGWAWLKCVLGGCEKAGGWLGPVEPWITGLLSGRAGHGLNAFWESGKTHVAVLGPFVPWTGWAWLKCVLGGCEKAGGWLGPLEPGLL